MGHGWPARRPSRPSTDTERNAQANLVRSYFTFVDRTVRGLGVEPEEDRKQVQGLDGALNRGARLEVARSVSLRLFSRVKRRRRGCAPRKFRGDP